MTTAFHLAGLLIAVLLLSAQLPVFSKNPFGTLKEDPPSLREIAFEHYLSGNKDVAFDFYEKAVRVAKKDYGDNSTYVGELYYEMGSLAFESTKFGKAEGYLEEAVKHNPNSLMARVKLAKLLEIRGRSDEALVQIQAALAKHSNSPLAHEAYVHWLEGQHKDAQAIHESFALNQAARGALPVPGTMVATAQPAEPEPAPKPAQTAPPAKPVEVATSLSPFEQVKRALQLQAESLKKAKQPAVQKSDQSKKREKPKEKQKSKQKDASLRVKPKAPKAKKSKPAPRVETAKSKETDSESAPALRTTAKKLNQDKHEKKPPQTEEQPAAAPEVVVSTPPPHQAVSAPRKGSKRKNEFVPAPPPIVPAFMVPGVGYPAPHTVQAAAPKAKPKEKPKVVEKQAAPPESAKPASSGDEDPDFLIQWAEVKKKKGK